MSYNILFEKNENFFKQYSLGTRKTKVLGKHIYVINLKITIFKKSVLGTKINAYFMAQGLDLAM